MLRRTPDRWYIILDLDEVVFALTEDEAVLRAVRQAQQQESDGYVRITKLAEHKEYVPS